LPERSDSDDPEGFLIEVNRLQSIGLALIEFPNHKSAIGGSWRVSKFMEKKILMKRRTRRDVLEARLALAAVIRQIRWKGWVENEEERQDHSQTGLKVIVPAYKAMVEAFSS
jgi:hypothetical protein